MKILLIGCGNMGQALLAGWHAVAEMSVVEPDATHYPAISALKVAYFPWLNALPGVYAPDIVALAVKPQKMEDVLIACRERFGAIPLYLSIAAGWETVRYRQLLGHDTRILRAMPNTPARVGESATALFAAPGVTREECDAVEQLFLTIGKIFWLHDERLMHAVTALSGSGPAYVYLFLEALAEAGKNHGLPEPIARELAQQTLAGAARLAALQPDKSLLELRQAVTSPGGTTAAAREVLEGDNRLKNIISEAVQAAVNRSRELAE